MLTPLIVESDRWDEAARIPLLVPSRDFDAVKLQWEAKAAAMRKVIEEKGGPRRGFES